MGKPKAQPLYELINAEHGKDVVLVGFGGSLVDFDWSLLNGWTTIGVNDVVLHHMPSYHLFVDSHLADRKYIKVKYTADCKIVCQAHAMQTFLKKNPTAHAHERMYIFQHQRKPAKHTENILFCDRTVAVAGLDLACRLGAARVYMIGVDGCGCGGGKKYYADKSDSRGGKKIDHERAKRQLAERARKDNVPLGRALERIDEYKLWLEPRHLDWWSNMGVLWKHWKREKRDFNVPRVINCSPWSLFTMWECLEPWDTVLETLRAGPTTTTEPNSQGSMESSATSHVSTLA